MKGLWQCGSHCSPALVGRQMSRGEKKEKLILVLAKRAREIKREMHNVLTEADKQQGEGGGRGGCGKRSDDDG